MDGQGSLPGRDKTFYLLHSVYTGSEVNLASHPVGTGLCPRMQSDRCVKVTTCTPFSEKVKNAWSL
jgi:hypothetical protein